MASRRGERAGPLIANKYCTHSVDCSRRGADSMSDCVGCCVGCCVCIALASKHFCVCPSLFFQYTIAPNRCKWSTMELMIAVKPGSIAVCAISRITKGPARTKCPLPLGNRVPLPDVPLRPVGRISDVISPIAAIASAEKSHRVALTGQCWQI